MLKGRRLCEYLALARASTDEDKDAEADLDSVDARSEISFTSPKKSRLKE